MQWVLNGSRLGYNDECSEYGMGHALVTMMNAVGRNGSRLGFNDECSGYGMGHAWVTMMNAVGMEWVTPGLQ